MRVPASPVAFADGIDVAQLGCVVAGGAPKNQEDYLNVEYGLYGGGVVAARFQMR